MIEACLEPTFCNNCKVMVPLRQLQTYDPIAALAQGNQAGQVGPILHMQGFVPRLGAPRGALLRRIILVATPKSR